MDEHRGAGADLALDRHEPARLPREPVDLAQSQPRALADLLRREERFERALEHVGPHPDAGVASRDHHVVPRCRSDRASLSRRDAAIPRRQRETTAVRHRVPRVDREIQDGGLELMRVGLAEPEILARMHVDADTLADRALQQLLERRQQMIDVQHFRVQVLAAREREQLVVELRAA